MDVCVARCLRFFVRVYTALVEKTTQNLPTTNTIILRKTENLLVVFVYQVVYVVGWVEIFARGKTQNLVGIL